MLVGKWKHEQKVKHEKAAKKAATRARKIERRRLRKAAA